MSTPRVNLTKWYPPVDDKPTPEHTALHIRLLYDGTNNHDQAITTLKGQLNNLSNTLAAKTAATNTSVPKPIPTMGGGVNVQTGQTSYKVQSADNASLIALNDASPIAVTLNSVLTAPFFTFIANQGTGTATLTPSGGVINGITSVPGGSSVIAFFDGTNWWIFYVNISGVFPQDTPAVAHEWIDSYDKTTGAFTQSQPAFSDISGEIAFTQVGFHDESLTDGNANFIFAATLSSGGDVICVLGVPN